MEFGPDGKPNRYSSLIPIYALNILGDPHFQDDDALRIFEFLSEEERNMSAVVEKARADYDAGFSSAYNDGIEKVARNMLNEGYDIESVAKCTGLSIEAVKRLQIY